MLRSRAPVTHLLAGERRVWKGLRAAMTRRRHGLVAVAYLGKGSFQRIKLAPGSTLVVNASDEAVKTGQTSPHEIMKFIRARVKVFSAEMLHAKVYVLGRRVFVGSANSSANSENRLDEAVLCTSDPFAVRAAQRYVQELAVDRIGYELARGLRALYSPPKLFLHGGARERPRRQGMLLTRLTIGTWDDAAYEAEARGLPSAKKQLKDSRFFRIQDFDWQGSGRGRFSRGRQVLRCTRQEGGRHLVEPPGRVVHVEPYRDGRTSGVVVFLEVAKDVRARPLSRVKEQLGHSARALVRLRGLRAVGNIAHERRFHALFDHSK